MLIDWFTVVAQGLNFVILVWLLKRFLYVPVLAAIAAREKRIADDLAGADAVRVVAEKTRVDLAQRSEAFDRDRDALLAAAQAAANVERGRLFDVARAAADALGAQRRERLAAEALALGDALRNRLRDGVFAIARKALTDVADSGLEASACALFTRRLRALDDQALADLAVALQGAKGEATVRSAFELPASERTAITQAMNETFAIETHVHYETAPALVCGIELAAGGRKLSWNFEADIAALETGVRGLLVAPEAAAPGAAAA